MGLPNRGITFYESFLPVFIKRAHQRNKRVRVSIVASTPREYGELVRRCLKIGIDEIEVNTSCPNVWKGSKQKEIPAFNTILLNEIIKESSKAARKFKLDIAERLK